MAGLAISRIDLIVYDFDGVMTNNKLFVDQSGNELVQVNRADGLGVSEIKKIGVDQIIISTETNPVVKKRAEKIGVECISGVSNKENVLKTYCLENNIDLKKVIYLGNDINDLEAMKMVGWPICPHDAHHSIKDISKYTLKKCGGEGVVRELFDLITNTKGE